MKAAYNYADQYGTAAVYIGGGAEYSGIAAYLDNCLIDGGGPVTVLEDGSTTGAEPIRFRGSDEEQNNAIYISNCTVTGDGVINFVNTTHRLYQGFGCRILSDTNQPSCIEKTSGAVYTAASAAEVEAVSA